MTKLDRQEQLENIRSLWVPEILESSEGKEVIEMLWKRLKKSWAQEDECRRLLDGAISCCKKAEELDQDIDEDVDFDIRERIREHLPQCRKHKNSALDSYIEATLCVKFCEDLLTAVYTGE